MMKPKQASAQKGPFKIFLDPGHGGHDPGAQSNGLHEKDAVLDMALKTKRVLEHQYKGVKTKISRSTDQFVELKQRANMANHWHADYFVSFHLNKSGQPSSGFETYIFNGNVSQETKTRQLHIHDYLINRINTKDRGRKTANFSVLRNTSMPAMLIEYGFLDNSSENQKLQKKSYRNKLGKLTADAIADTYDLDRK